MLMKKNYLLFFEGWQMPLQTHQTNRFRNFERVEERRQLYNELPKPAPYMPKPRSPLL